MGASLSEDAQVLWAQIQAEQAPDAEPQEMTEAEQASVAEEPAIADDAPVSDAVPEVSQAEYVDALVQIAAELTAENLRLREIAATALEQAREVEHLRQLLGVTEPAPIEEDPSPDLSQEFMAATAAAVEALRSDVETLRSEDAALLGDVLRLRSQLRALAEVPRRRRWWRFGR